MSFYFISLLIVANFLIHQVTSELYPSSNGNLSVENYASNTPFSSNSDMESFIRNEWLDYPTIDIESLMNSMKEILYTSFNPNKTNIRVCQDQPLTAYRNRHPSNKSDLDQIFIMMPSSMVSLKDFKLSMELMTVLNDADNKLRYDMIKAMKNINSLEKNEDCEMVKYIKNCEVTVVIPHLFKSNYCIISPVIESYLPSLANVSLVKMGNIFLRYNSVKNLVQNVFTNQSWNETGAKLENISISKNDQVPFESLRRIVETFEKNQSSFYLKIHQEGFGDTDDIPLSHWSIVYDSLHTNIRNYLKSIMSQNGSNSNVYEKLPWIGYRGNITTGNRNNITTISIPNHISYREKSQSNSYDDEAFIPTPRQYDPFNPRNYPSLYRFDSDHDSENSIQQNILDSDDFVSPTVRQIAFHQPKEKIKPRSRYHVGSNLGSETYRSNLLEYKEKKNRLKNQKKILNKYNDIGNRPFTNIENRNPMVGKFSPLSKSRNIGRPISDYSLTSARANDYEASKDHLVEELQNEFNSLQT